MKGRLETICINCPMGCPLVVEEIDGEIKVTGYTCLRGKKYGEQEYINPMRVVTTLVLCEDGTAQPVKMALHNLLRLLVQYLRIRSLQ